MALEIWIPALATLLGAAISGYLSYKGGEQKGRKKTLLELDSQTREASRHHEEVVGRFGWKCKEFISSAKTDNEGNSTISRAWRGLTPIGGATLKHLQGRFWVGTPGASIAGEPTLRVSPGLNKDIDLVITDRREQSCLFRIDIMGSLTEQDPSLDMEIEVQHKKAVLMSKTEVEKAYKGSLFPRDYHAFDVLSPIDKLILKVEFPPDVAITLHPFVFFAHSEIENPAELKRVDAGFTAQGTKAHFVIQEPLIGLRYIIFWKMLQ